MTANIEAGNFEGFASYLRNDVVMSMRGVGDPGLQRRFAASNEALAADADQIAKQLSAFAATGNNGHVLGAQGYLDFLRDEEGLETALPAFKKIAEDDLAKNRSAFEELSTHVSFTRQPRDQIIPTAERLVGEARAFIVAHHIVALPPGAQQVLVKAPQSFKRWANGYLGGSGKTAVFYVGVPDASWPPAKQQDYTLPDGELHNAVAHEVYPGHYIQALWADQAPTQVQRLSFDNVFNEGWAHYAEQMMLEEGFGAEDPQNRLGQLRAALRRDCRMLASVGIHTEGMTVDQAERLFVERCEADPENAHREAERATFDPGYFAYTLGKSQILSLRAEAQRRLGSRFSLERFHDVLLGHGRPPVALLREPVLRELGALP